MIPTSWSEVPNSIEALAFSIIYEVDLSKKTWINLRDSQGMYCGYIVVPAEAVYGARIS